VGPPEEGRPAATAHRAVLRSGQSRPEPSASRIIAGVEGDADRPVISVILVTRGRHALLDRCLASLAAQLDAPPIELLVCTHDDDGAARVVHRRFPDATVVAVAQAHPGEARNLLIDRAEGELLLFVDDDVVLRRDLLARLADLSARHPDASVFGGPNLTPPGSTRFQVTQGAVLGSLVASGPVRFRYGRHPAKVANERYFTLCNLAVRRCHMPLFDPRLVCAEENAAMTEMHRRGLLMRYDPELVVYHERRSGYRSFCQQMFKYGTGRGQVLTDTRPPGSLPHLVPLVWMGYLVTAPVLALLVGLSWLIPLGVYLVGVSAAALKVGTSLRRARSVPLAGALIASLHVCYGTGVAAGLVRGRRAAVPRRAAARPVGAALPVVPDR